MLQACPPEGKAVILVLINPARAQPLFNLKALSATLVFSVPALGQSVVRGTDTTCRWSAATASATRVC